MESDRGEHGAQPEASQAPSGQPSMQMSTPSSTQDMARTAMHANAPLAADSFAYSGDMMPSDVQQWQTHPHASFDRNFPQVSRSSDQAAGTAFNRSYDSGYQQILGSGYNMDNHAFTREPTASAGMEQSSSTFMPTQTQGPAFLPLDSNAATSRPASRPHAGQNTQGIGQLHQLGTGREGDWQQSGETPMPFGGPAGFPQQQLGLASGRAGNFAPEGHNSFTSPLYTRAPQQPFNSTGTWTSSDQLHARNNAPASMGVASGQNQVFDITTYNNLPRACSELNLDPPNDNTNMDPSQAGMYQDASAPWPSAGQRGPMYNASADSNHWPQANYNSLLQNMTREQRIAFWAREFADNFLPDQCAPNVPHQYMQQPLQGHPSSQLPFAPAQVTSAYQNNTDHQLPAMPSGLPLPKPPSHSPTPDAELKRPPTPPKSPPPFAPRVPAEYAEAAKRQFELGEQRLANIAEIEAEAERAEELREEETPPGERLPGHEQMKVKTDGRTIFVRKTDFFISFHHTRKVKVDKERLKVHAAPKTEQPELDILPVAMYPDAFPPGTRGFFVPMVEKSPLRIKFEPRFKKGRNPYMIRIYAGATNIISGKVDFGKKDNREQDYIVVPPQEHIDGFALTKDIGEQFLTPIDPNQIIEDVPKKVRKGRKSNKGTKGAKDDNGDKDDKDTQDNMGDKGHKDHKDHKDPKDPKDNIRDKDDENDKHGKGKERANNVESEKNTLPVVSSLRFEITPFEFEHHADFFVRANGWQDRKLMIPVHEKEPVEFPGRIQRYFDIDSSLIKWTYNGRKYRDDWSVNEIGIQPDPARKQNDKIDIVSANRSEALHVKDVALDEIANGSLRKHGELHQDYRYFLKPLQNDPLNGTEPDRPRVPTTAFETGGLLEQVIVYDPYPNLWNPARTTCFEVHIVSEKHWQEIVATREQEAPARRPLDPPLRPCEADEINIYDDLNDTELELFDEPVEKFEVRDLSGPWSEFTSVRSHLPNPYVNQQ